jgi:putative secretion ATPase (PEP-CTERM system associated)
MYTQHFGLSAKPFELLPNPRFLYLGKGHKKALSYLRYGLQERAGFTLLTGEVGSGKTTLLRDILNTADKKNTLAMIFNTKVSGLQLLAMVNEEFGLAIQGQDKVALLRGLNDFLVAEYALGRQPILIIDEAQNLTAEALEEVRLLSNLEADNYKLLQIVLVGQPELKAVIARPELRQLRQRISVSCHLGPLSRDELEEYIHHRLATAGNRDAVTFSTEVFDLIYRFSQGVPRLINLLCDSLLLAAFVEETREITLELAEESVEDLSISEPDDEDRRGTPGSDAPQGAGAVEQRLARVEEQYLRLNAARAEREAMLDRLSSQGSILEYLINQQQKQFSQFDESLKKISGQIDRLRMLVLSQADQDIVRLDARKKESS